MKFLCTSDLHGIVPVQIKNIVEERNVDAILYGGDFAPHGWGGEGSRTEDPMNFLVSLGLPIFSVFGNIDPDKKFFEDFESRNKNFHFIHLKRVKVGDFYLIGLGDFYFEDYALKTFESLLKQKPEKTIVISHYPPYGAVDRTDFGTHVGSRELRELIERYRPLLVVCGHIHEAAGIDNIGKTVVANVAMRNVLVEIENGEVNVSLV